MGNVTAYTDAAGNVTANAFDANDNLLTTSDPSGSVFGFEYDENEQQTVTTSSVTTANGVETVRLEKVYDSLNRVTEQIDADGLSTKAEYDALGRQTATVDKLGNRMEMQYDPRNLVISAVSSNGSTETNTYDAAGRLTAKRDAQGNMTQHEYDAVGNLTNTHLPNGVSVEHEYDALGRMIGATSSLGLHTSREYDAAGRLLAETDTQGRTTRYVYYPDGKRKQVIDSRGNVYAYEYDAAGHQVKTIYPDGSTETAAYDERGKQVVETDRLGHTTAFAWNRFGLLEGVTDPLGHTTTFEYNEIGNLLSQTDSNGHTTSFEYNKLGQLTKKTYPLGMSQTTQYDAENNTITVKDFNGDTIVSEYDTLGRLATVHLPDGSTMAYSYTSSGQIHTVSEPRGTVRYTYDDDNRLLSRTEPDGITVSYTYDQLGRRSSVTVPSCTTTYEYDNYGRLLFVREPDGGETRYTYDEHGNKASAVFPNGITTVYGYDKQNRLIAMEHQALSGTVLASYTVTLNAKGQRIHVEEQPTGRVIDYDYDAADRLIEERISDPALGNRTIGYSYDPVGNRMTRNDNGVITEYSYDDNDRLLTEKGFSYTYDNNGNMLTKSGNGEDWGLAYNALNQLTHANISTPQGVSSVEYAYDHDGIRIGRTVNGTDVIRYVVDKNLPYAQVLEEERINGLMSATTSYVYGDALLSATTEGVTQYYHTDGMGSVRGLSDASGTITDGYAYDAYGMLLGSLGNTVNPYRYRGEQYDSDLGSYYLRARYYQPGTGRFMTTDPVEGVPTTPMSFHRYMYGNGNPVSMIDPSGEMSMNEAIITGGIVGNLSLMAVGSLTGPGRQAYSWVAEKVFPDAFVVGAAGIFSVNLTPVLNRVKKAISTYLNVSLPPSLPTINGFYTEGFEVLLSVSSAQLTAFHIKGGGLEIQDTKSPLGNFGGSIYKGYVWNLWNDKDYRGWFAAMSVGDIAMFWDRDRMFQGPWGVARPIKTKWMARNKPNISASVSGVYYSLWDRHNFNREFELVPLVLIVEAIDMMVRTGTSASAATPANVAQAMLRFSVWVQLGTAKTIWNRQEGFTVEERQKKDSQRPSHYHNGPTMPVLW